MATKGNGDPPVLDFQTMKELCQPSLNGRGGPIAPIVIQATNFGLKNDMIQQSIKVNGVTDDALRLYLFPHSLTHHATAWFDRLPRNSINTFKQMAKMFLGKYFPPSMVTKLRNEITNFSQRPNESIFEVWERYKLSINQCPNYNMLPVTQIDTFYTGLTLRHRDTINVAAGGTFMKRPQRSESSSSITSSSDPETVALKAKMAEINKNLIRVLQVNQQVKAVTASCETCGGPHSYNDCPAIVGQTQNVYAAGAYQGGNSYQPQGYRNLLSYRSDNYLGPLRFNQNQNRNNQNQNFQNQNRNQGNNHGIPQGNNQGRNQFFQRASHVMTTTEFTNYMKENDAILKNMQTNVTSLINSNLEPKNMFGQFMKMNTASSSGSGTLPSNTITNPKEDLKGITTQSGTVYQGPTIPTPSSSSPNVVECETEMTKDIVTPTNNERTKDVQPLVVQIETPIPNSELVVTPVIEPVVAPVSALKPNQKPSILSLKTKKALIEVYEGELTLRIGKKAITFNLDQTSRYSANYNDMTANQINVIDMACEEYSQEVLGFSNVIASGNPTPYYDLIVSTSPLTLTPSEDNDFLHEEVDAFLALEDDPTSPEFDHSYFDTEGDILLLKAFLNDDPSLPPPNQGKCMMAIFHDMIEKTMEVFMDDFSEKSHFMVKEGIVLGHKISKNGIEVDKAKVDVIPMLPNPTTVKGLDPRAFISDRGTHFYNDQFAKVMLKYGVTHRLAIVYHPQTSGHVEVSNRGLNQILERIVGENHASWSDKLDDALWAFRTASKTPTGCTPYKLVYEKACHLPIELEHKAYWALKHANFDLQTVGDHCKLKTAGLDHSLSPSVPLWHCRVIPNRQAKLQGEWSQTKTLLWRGHTKRWLSRISKPSLRTNEFGDWVKLSDPKQALYGRHPMLILVVVMNKCVVVWRLTLPFLVFCGFVCPGILEF
nr:reverse transcriptase domain-containing protein [Tanacetum cinerariifolium]